MRAFLDRSVYFIRKLRLIKGRIYDEKGDLLHNNICQRLSYIPGAAHDCEDASAMVWGCGCGMDNMHDVLSACSSWGIYLCTLAD
jgi:hypothetical protein